MVGEEKRRQHPDRIWGEVGADSHGLGVNVAIDLERISPKVVNHQAAYRDTRSSDRATQLHLQTRRRKAEDYIRATRPSRLGAEWVDYPILYEVAVLSNESRICSLNHGQYSSRPYLMISLSPARTWYVPFISLVEPNSLGPWSTVSPSAPLVHQYKSQS